MKINYDLEVSTCLECMLRFLSYRVVLPKSLADVRHLFRCIVFMKLVWFETTFHGMFLGFLVFLLPWPRGNRFFLNNKRFV